MSIQNEGKSTTVNTLKQMKARGEKIVCLTAYDATFAQIVEQAGVNAVLVGDSLGMVIQGHQSTVPVSVDDVVYHTRCVARGLRHALLMADMPFLSYTTPQQALSNAARLMQDGGAAVVKLEGGPSQVEIVSLMSDHGIPVCAHLGLQPQRIHKMGGYYVQGRAKRAADKLLEHAGGLCDAGADLLLLECVPGLLAAEITRNVDIPVIGIGAGADCDGQILVLQDVLGITPGRAPCFTRNFLTEGKTIPEAIQSYGQAVRDGRFPAKEHTFSD